MKKYLLIVCTLLIASAHAGFWDDDAGSTSTKPNTQETPKKDQEAKPKPARKPLRRPANLTPLERSILDTFERQLAPLADQLSALTASPEARQAREAKLKEWEQKTKEGQRRSRTEDGGGRRWWAPDDGSSYRPSRSGGFGGGYGGGGFGGSSLPRYWTPPSEGGDHEFGDYHPHTGTSDHRGHGPSDLTTGYDHESTQGDEPERTAKEKKDKGGQIFDTDKINKAKENFDKAISLLTHANQTIDDLKIKLNPDDKAADQLLEEETIKGLEKTITDAIEAEKLINEDSKKAMPAKTDEWKKQNNRLTGLYAKLLPLTLRAATKQTDQTDEQKNIKKFIEKRIAPKVTVQTYNTALHERESQLLDDLDRQPATTRALEGGATAEQINEQKKHVQELINCMPKGRGDHKNAGVERLEQRLATLNSRQRAAEQKVAEDTKKAATKNAAETKKQRL